MTCVPYQLDSGCAGDEWDGFDEDLRERASDLAWRSLRSLTGGLVGNCPVMVRPCATRCAPTAGQWGVTGAFTPRLQDGAWYNDFCGSCGPRGCSCDAVSEIVLPGLVADIGGVYEGGAKLDPTAYRVDNGNRVVRVDGGAWPTCQPMGEPWDGPNALAIVYVPGVRPSAAGRWAAGVLAWEFAKACSGAKCRLPSSVTSIARQGVSMEFSEGFFAGGVTGIREVDAYVLSLNPKHLSQPSRVWSPDMAQPRYQSSPALVAHVPTPPDSDTGPFAWDFSPAFDAAGSP